MYNIFGGFDMTVEDIKREVQFKISSLTRCYNSSDDPDLRACYIVARSCLEDLLALILDDEDHD